MNSVFQAFLKWVEGTLLTINSCQVSSAQSSGQRFKEPGTGAPYRVCFLPTNTGIFTPRTILSAVN